MRVKIHPSSGFKSARTLPKSSDENTLDRRISVEFGFLSLRMGTGVQELCELLDTY